nr:MAG TPA: hypothetical protein [Siphoviridae sp. ctBWu8]
MAYIFTFNLMVRCPTLVEILYSVRIIIPQTVSISMLYNIN